MPKKKCEHDDYEVIDYDFGGGYVLVNLHCNECGARGTSSYKYEDTDWD